MLFKLCLLATKARIGMARLLGSFGVPARQHGEQAGDGRSLAHLALGPDAPAVGLDQALGDGQSQATAGPLFVGAGRVAAPEAVKDAWQIIGRDALPVVRDPE